jgi:hypothetical protein
MTIGAPVCIVLLCDALVSVQWWVLNFTD